MMEVGLVCRDWFYQHASCVCSYCIQDTSWLAIAEKIDFCYIVGSKPKPAMCWFYVMDGFGMEPTIYLTLHVKSMWWEVILHLIFLIFDIPLQK